MEYSPLFWPIKFKTNKIYILDETELPHRTVYVEAKDYLQACKAIKDMKTRAVGQVILVFYMFLQAINQNKGKNLTAGFNKVAAAINSTRPTLSFKYLTDMILHWHNSGVPLDKIIPGFLDALKNARIKQAEQAAMLMQDKDVILTHCNISGLLPLMGAICAKENKNLSFFVTETRPYLQGARLTAWELERAGFDVTVIADNMVAQVFSERKISKVIVGADHLAQNGDIANKIGTFQIALLARHFNIPFYVLCPPPSALKTGKEIKIEIRPEKELLELNGKRLVSKGVKGYYPAFDITPSGLITKHIHLEIDRKLSM